MSKAQAKLTALVLALYGALALATNPSCDRVGSPEGVFMKDPRHNDHLYFRNGGAGEGLCKTSPTSIQDGSVRLGNSVYPVEEYVEGAQPLQLTDDEIAWLRKAGYDAAQYLASGASSISAFLIGFWLGHPAPSSPPDTEPPPNEEEDSKGDGESKVSQTTPTPQPEASEPEAPESKPDSKFVNDPKPAPPVTADDEPKESAESRTTAGHGPGAGSNVDEDSADVGADIRRSLDARNKGKGARSGDDLLDKKGPPHFESKPGRRLTYSDDSNEAERAALYAKERAEMDWNRRAQELLRSESPTEADMIAALKDLMGLDPDMSVADSLSDLFGSEEDTARASKRKKTASSPKSGTGGRWPELASAIDPYGLPAAESYSAEETPRARAVGGAFGDGAENTSSRSGSGRGGSDDDIWISKSVVLSNNSAISPHLVEKLIRKLTGAAQGEVAVWEKAAGPSSAKLDRLPASKSPALGSKVRRMPGAVSGLFAGGVLLFFIAALRRRRDS